MTNLSLEMQAPFNPAAKLAILSTWQANDPLVHYHTADLRLAGTATNHQYLKPSQAASNVPPSSLGFLNNRYSPWGPNPLTAYESPTAYNRSLRDPGISSPDDWNFPTNETLSSAWLGRIHRGTPWQTIYLKAEPAGLFGPDGWTNSSPGLATNANGMIFSRTHPTNDWKLVALLASLLNTNDLRTLTSINTTNAAEWTSTFSGLTVLSNDLTTVTFGAPVGYETNVITADAPQLATILSGIERKRAARRGEYFNSVADLLSVPELSTASPWLNLSGDQLKWGITEEGYEMLPNQLLALVRADPVGTAAISNGTVFLHFTAEDGLAYRVESTSDFASWTKVSEPHYSTNGVFGSSVVPANGPRFFRAVQQAE